MQSGATRTLVSSDSGGCSTDQEEWLPGGHRTRTDFSRRPENQALILAGMTTREYGGNVRRVQFMSAPYNVGVMRYLDVVLVRSWIVPAFAFQPACGPSGRWVV